MLTSEFQKAFEYTKGLIKTDTASIILFLACLIPYVNYFVLMRYVDKIVSEPSTSNTPPKLVNPNWTELIVSLLKIIVVALVWVAIGVALIVPAGLILGLGMLAGFSSVIGFITKFSVALLGLALYVLIVVVAVSFLAIMSEVNMLKNGKNLMAAFAFKDLLAKIMKIGLLRYILFNLSLLIVCIITGIITSQVGNYIEIFSISVMGIITLFTATFFAKTISVLYDQNAVASPQPQ